MVLFFEIEFYEPVKCECPNEIHYFCELFTDFI